MSLPTAEHMNNVADHVDRLKILLDRPAPEGTKQRIYRARGMLNDAFVVMTILQTMPGYQGDPKAGVRLYVATTHANPQATLTGQYAVDEIVAFLGLDKIEAKYLDWLDETRYGSNLVVVGDSLRALRIDGN